MSSRDWSIAIAKRQISRHTLRHHFITDKKTHPLPGVRGRPRLTMAMHQHLAAMTQNTNLSTSRTVICNIISCAEMEGTPSLHQCFVQAVWLISITGTAVLNDNGGQGSSVQIWFNCCYLVQYLIDRPLSAASFLPAKV